MPEAPILSVSQFIESLNIILADKVYPQGVMVEGEVVQYKVSQNKWIWFDLKDETGLVSCFATVWQVRTPLEDGMKVRVHGLPKLYPKNGRFSLTVDRVEPVGEGALKRAFELLKKRLADEGLFAPERKRPLPRFPERIGLIASTESAAYSDFIRILGDRWGGMTVHAAHVQVQGQGAVADIVGAFRHFNANPGLAEVLVLTRGGGSLEDLQAFNSEEVARAVFSSKIPVIVAVGHERDESLADFVADVRASTPSNAAERLTPDRRDIQREIAAAVAAMDAALAGSVAASERRLYEFETHLTEHVRQARAECDALFADLRNVILAMEKRVVTMRTAVDREERVLKSLDPQAVLGRGYAIARGADGRILRDPAGVDKGAAVSVQLQKGTLKTQAV
jgi:exodeoxyribonuclease VII large subunit